MKKRFDIIYAPSVKQHLQSVELKYHSLIRKNIEAQLQSEPDVKTKNRKPLEHPGIFDSQWEIRFGPANCFRVFYKVDKKINEVYILAIGVKQGNRLYIGGKEIK